MPLFQGRSTLISETNLATLATLDLVVPPGFRHLRLELHSRFDVASDLCMLLGAPTIDTTAANYDKHIWTFPTAGASSASFSAASLPDYGTMPVAADAANMFASTKIDIFNPSDAVWKNILAQHVNPVTAIHSICRGLWRNTGLVGNIRVRSLNGTSVWATNSSVRLFGDR